MPCLNGASRELARDAAGGRVTHLVRSSSTRFRTSTVCGFRVGFGPAVSAVTPTNTNKNAPASLSSLSPAPSPPGWALLPSNGASGHSMAVSPSADSSHRRDSPTYYNSALFPSPDTHYYLISPAG